MKIKLLLISSILLLTSCFLYNREPVPWEIPEELTGVYEYKIYAYEGHEQTKYLSIFMNNTYMVGILKENTKPEEISILSKIDGQIEFLKKYPGNKFINAGVTLVDYRNDQLVVYEQGAESYLVYKKIK